MTFHFFSTKLSRHPFKIKDLPQNDHYWHKIILSHYSYRNYRCLCISYTAITRSYVSVSNRNTSKVDYSKFYESLYVIRNKYENHLELCQYRIMTNELTSALQNFCYKVIFTCEQLVTFNSFSDILLILYH